MSHTTSLHQKAVYLINAHNGVRQISSAIAGSFTLAFLYKQGIPLPYLLFSLAGVYALRFLIRFAVLPVLRHVGLRTGMIVGNLLYPLRYLALIPIQQIDHWFFLFIFFYAASEAIYITCYHAYWAATSRVGHSGRSLGAREAIIQIANIIGVVGSGYALGVFGPSSSFVVGAICAAVASAPLFFLPSFPVSTLHPSHPTVQHHTRKVYRVLLAEGFHAAGWYTIWPILVFTIAGAHFSSFGNLLGLAGLMQAIGWYAAGRYLDGMDKHRMAAIGAMAMIVVVLGRVFFGWSIPAIIVLDMLAVLAIVLYQPVMASTAYELIKESQSVLTASFWHEFGWESGAVASFLTAGILMLFGMDIHVGLLTAGMGLVASGVMLFSYHYKKPPAPSTASTQDPAVEGA